MVMAATCVECGGRVTEVRGPVEWVVRDRHVVVPDIPHGICTQCGEIYYDADIAHDAHLAAVDIIKKEMGLLTSCEIRALRTSLDLTQAQFEQIIGAGPKTVVRWENGSVFQNKTADTLMRIIRDYPTVRADLISQISA